MNKLLVLYRACGKELKQEEFKPQRVSYFNKLKTWQSFINGGFYNNKDVDIKVIWDGPENWFTDHIKNRQNLTFVPVNYKSNKGSLDYCFQILNQESKNYEFGSIIEEDHFYLPGSCDVLFEGLNAFYPHFVALADHLDRYKINNGDIITTDGIFITKSKHWRTAESSVLSVSFPMETFQKFKNDMIHYNSKGVDAMHEREFFRSIIPKGYRLFTPIPAMSTHAVISDLSPCINWEKFVETIQL